MKRKFEITTFPTSSRDFQELMRSSTTNIGGPDPIRDKIFETMKERLPGLINNAADFQNILWHLLPQQCSVVFELMRAQLPSMIVDGRSLQRILTFLPINECHILLDTIKENLPEIIKTHRDFMILQHLSEPTRTVVTEFLGKELPITNKIKWEVCFFGGILKRNHENRPTDPNSLTDIASMGVELGLDSLAGYPTPN